eukprot:1621975-Pleurochrysis_carterae.AAC.1
MADPRPVMADPRPVMADSRPVMADPRPAPSRIPRRDLFWLQAPCARRHRPSSPRSTRSRPTAAACAASPPAPRATRPAARAPPPRGCVQPPAPPRPAPAPAPAQSGAGEGRRRSPAKHTAEAQTEPRVKSERWTDSASGCGVRDADCVLGECTIRLGLTALARSSMQKGLAAERKGCETFDPTQCDD